LPLCVAILLITISCTDSGSDDTFSDLQAAPPLAVDGQLNVNVLIPEDSGPGLQAAAQDMLDAFASIAGVESEAHIKGDTKSMTHTAAVLIVVDPETNKSLGEQDYILSRTFIDPDKHVLLIGVSSETAAIYGIYHVLGDMGVLYFHPEETYIPQNSAATLPLNNYKGELSHPRFAIRGFHEHTQHPIIMSDVYLRPGNDKFREYASNYIRWMARNRQNLMSWQMLKTVDLDEWLPYISDIIEEAHEFGIKVSMFISFVDQQQNMFKLIDEEALDPERGQPISDEEQIKAGLDRLMSAGFDSLGFQIGSSEFTKPADSEMLEWMEIARQHLEDNYPGVTPYAWVHTTCDLESDDGGYYFHLPLKADESFGAYVHTTMFYDLEHSAPVYSCENFHQQMDFVKAADGKRPLVYFPESAWWLGFDNNCPVVLPVTGYTRAYDIDTLLTDYQIDGHVTFTSGREWTYWMYDHFLTQKTWNGELSWNDYLIWISPLYGENGEAVKDVLLAWTDLQMQHFLLEDPLIYFYVAGELRQDEVGEMAGILARRPKLSFQKVLDMDENTFNTWKNSDLSMLRRMQSAYVAELEKLPQTLEGGSDAQKHLYKETYSGLYVFVKRIEHAIALYEGVAESRAWALEKQRAAQADPVEDPDETIRTSALATANAKLESAETITREVLAIFKDMENEYRYPIELLAREKPETKTAYPYGYLEQTSSGHFWTRRDKQLEDVIGVVFDTLVEEWETIPSALYTADSDSMELTTPDDPLAGSVITSFMPQLLFGVGEINLDSGAMTLIIAQDFNTNLLPDANTEQNINGSISDGVFTGGDLAYSVVVHDSSGALMGDLLMLDPEFVINLNMDGDKVELIDGSLSGAVDSQALVNLVMTVGGIDEEGTSNIIKSIYGIEKEEPLPESLPTAFGFTLTKASLK